ncbi:hypothetical protein HRI_003606100 [Hibiscus trionum]|uniref:Diacylglycerol kinase accessory domain-containing protein n=1 Tax=Hibiscus trionum TaxID=183268 RepID=A0A9W7ISP2_HIBTR|nr:hypothetical protein HRI_003606100 [Hibiscus trionum]
MTFFYGCESSVATPPPGARTECSPGSYSFYADDICDGGMDAQTSYAFHSERKLHLEKFRNQLINQGTYVKLGCTRGWLFGSLFRPSPTNIAQLTKVKVMKKQGQWKDLKTPRSIESVLCLNLPSFSGGFNPLGTLYRKKFLDRGLTPPFVDDGLIEIVGFRNVLHELVLLAPNGHGYRLAHANAVRFEFKKDFWERW